MLPARLASRLSQYAARSVVSWNQIALFPFADPERAEALPLRPTVGTDALTTWRSGAIAALLLQLHPYAGSQVLSVLPPTMAAKVLGRLPPLQRLRVLKHLSVPQAAAIVQRLAPAAAVAVLDALPEGFALALLENLNTEGPVPLHRMLTGRPNAAGGLMTRTRLRISQDCTAAEAVALIRALRDTPGQRTYLYCLGSLQSAISEACLVGVISL